VGVDSCLQQTRSKTWDPAALIYNKYVKEKDGRSREGEEGK
jgi:hypothetical protein